ESVVAPLFVPYTPSPHRAIRNADNLGGLHPSDLPLYSPQYNFLYLHRPVQSSGRINCHPLTSESDSRLSQPCPSDRTDHLLPTPDISFATDTPSVAHLTPQTRLATV